ncbi:pyridoxamine 5'-phosphate oxidase [Acidithiobacillus sp. CV18-2]|uniref:Pyridoxine/pyridoxamine 5'-phosphate oxidase n=1 Tax=Igneacidithiobacillus copahuensis TaxID=2724909 RepID=A0AAE3CJM2_9PROT|nr:pyridoxamine 5'-phosphate oxidase [Acidithiobacillus sp. CV18-3]MBU2758230.1 pyridoxamine 5'-phosphate oxidase [Acidithiobacillus sp. BN09-2]MBU2777488.1 pyridoxamine 5'-phosphate oxidase [Acidithiobacillus sp. CV18-2]MBU2787909.1 pyridoxamine 5'-phosphate oxidase [Igneacidithiobacillus copahuensis]MBU2796802.1 pyridoxamine 5'-phosphate oxidase [Acidithiobacillus sp. VAN18-2]MBU2800412.1 pyridoxamine 5'-phosphate oxidase [Acidithiobacillus sp. VAN18-4]UTV80244.1 pyridoxamine 5'-phosphate o
MEGEIDHRATRRDFRAGTLARADLDADPWVQMQRWLEEAERAGNFDPTAMALATADGGGFPNVRYVLLKHFDARGVCWYTDSRSQKGQELAANGRAALAFYWPELDRQLRLQGEVSLLPESDAERYFRQRPVGSRLAAAASEQSREILDRAHLEARVAELAARYPDGDVPRNPAWRGYRLAPQRFEFWQGRSSRLHDRFVYTHNEEGWRITRLMP